VGLGEIATGVTIDAQALVVERPCECPGIPDHLFGVVIAEAEHFVCSTQETQHRAQVMIADVARKCAGPDLLPQRLERGTGRDVAEYDATLGTEKGLVRRTSDDIGAFPERVLEMAAE
jgi:hypothetical protein